ncbi:hypothetical protein QL285_045562 [Trifolium repens]|nr:hypothetical protein QL285_045562 [Trifolium repens]
MAELSNRETCSRTLLDSPWRGIYSRGESFENQRNSSDLLAAATPNLNHDLQVLFQLPTKVFPQHASPKQIRVRIWILGWKVRKKGFLNKVEMEGKGLIKFLHYHVFHHPQAEPKN